MKDIGTKREREKKMISQMIALYCRRNHHTRGALCPECAALNDYAPRPELPQCFIASSTASYTASGFLIVVAALSR